jgi:hypothetical protein
MALAVLGSRTSIGLRPHEVGSTHKKETNFKGNISGQGTFIELDECVFMKSCPLCYICSSTGRCFFLRRSFRVLLYCIIAGWFTEFFQPFWLFTSSFLILMNLFVQLAVDSPSYLASSSPQFWMLWSLSLLSVLLHAAKTSPTGLILAFNTTFVCMGIFFSCHKR